jgi:hypothetical protein
LERQETIKNETARIASQQVKKEETKKTKKTKKEKNLDKKREIDEEQKDDTKGTHLETRVRTLHKVLHTGPLRRHHQIVVHQPNHHALGRSATGPIQSQAHKLRACAEHAALHVTVVQIAKQWRKHRSLRNACNDNKSG